MIQFSYSCFEYSCQVGDFILSELDAGRTDIKQNDPWFQFCRCRVEWDKIVNLTGFLRETNMTGIAWKYCGRNASIYIYQLNHVAQPPWFSVCYFANGIIFCDFFRNENTIGFMCFLHSECKAVNMLQLFTTDSGITSGDVLRPIVALYSRSLPGFGRFECRAEVYSTFDRVPTWRLVFLNVT